MSARTLTDRECADIVDDYDLGHSYDALAHKYGISSSTVQRVMRECSPGSIRKKGRQKKLAVVKELGLSLASLDQMWVGPCLKCRVDLVWPRLATPVVREQTCGLCVADMEGVRAA